MNFDSKESDMLYTLLWYEWCTYLGCILALFIFLKSMSNCFTSNKEHRKRSKAFRVSGDF